MEPLERLTLFCFIDLQENINFSMKVSKIIILGIITFFIFSCSISSYQKKGYVSPKEFYYKTKFTTKKSVIILPAKINGIEKNFLFDTGADYNVIQRDTLIGSKESFEGATNREVKMGTEITKSIKIGNIDFVNTYSANTDLAGLKEQIPYFGGLIGQSVILKANWLINYPDKELEISNKNIADSTFLNIKIMREDGAPYTYISIDNKDYRVLIDFGSSSHFNVPKSSKLGKHLLNKYNFNDRTRERYTVGGLQTVTEKLGITPSIKLGELEFNNIETTINVSSQPRIGVGFFKNCKIYIDNLNGLYKLKKQ